MRVTHTHPTIHDATYGICLSSSFQYKRKTRESLTSIKSLELDITVKQPRARFSEACNEQRYCFAKDHAITLAIRIALARFGFCQIRERFIRDRNRDLAFPNKIKRPLISRGGTFVDNDKRSDSEISESEEDETSIGKSAATRE